MTTKTIINQIETGKEAVNAARYALGSGDTLIVVYQETIYYACISDPVTSQRKRPYGVKVYRKSAKHYCHVYAPRWFKTLDSAVRAAHKIAFA